MLLFIDLKMPKYHLHYGQIEIVIQSSRKLLSIISFPLFACKMLASSISFRLLLQYVKNYFHHHLFIKKKMSSKCFCLFSKLSFFSPIFYSTDLCSVFSAVR